MPKEHPEVEILRANGIYVDDDGVYDNADIDGMLATLKDSDNLNDFRPHLNCSGRDEKAILDCIDDGSYERFDRYDSDVCEIFITAYENWLSPKGKQLLDKECLAMNKATERYFDMVSTVEQSRDFWPNNPHSADFVSTMVFGFYNNAIDSEEHKLLGSREDTRNEILLAYSIYRLDDVPGKTEPVYKASHEIPLVSTLHRKQGLIAVAEDITWMVYQINGGKAITSKKELIETITAPKQGIDERTEIPVVPGR